MSNRDQLSAEDFIGRFVRDKWYAEKWPDGIHAIGIGVYEQPDGRLWVRCLGNDRIKGGGAGSSRLVCDLEIVPDSEAFAWVLKNRRTGYPNIGQALESVLGSERRRSDEHED